MKELIMSMTSSRPYLLRGIYQWIVDNGMTPYMLVNTNMENVQVPGEHVSNGKITLNVSPSAVQDLDMGGRDVRFHARFSGKSQFVCAPVHSIMAIYAKENGRGMVFAENDDIPPEPTQRKIRQMPIKKRNRPMLRVVK